jgi:hypothetical protein
MNLDPTSTDDMLDLTIHRFQEALESKPLAIHPEPHNRALLAFDGSNQDPTVLGLAMAISPALGQEAKFEIVLASESGATPKQKASLEKAKEVLGDKIRAIHEPDRAIPAYGQILHAAQMANADLIIAPAPFLRDLEELGADSVGTVLDMLLARFSGTLLMVRLPKEAPAGLLEEWHWPLFPQQKDPTLGANAIGGLIQSLPVRQIHFYPVADSSLMDLAGKIAGKPRNIKEALQNLHAPLLSGLQKFCSNTPEGPRVSIQPVQGGLPEIMDRLNRNAGLIITRLSSHPQPEALEKVRQIILHSANPILVSRG